MARASREGALRVEQRIDETPDLFLIRAFVLAVPYMKKNEAMAAARWMVRKAMDPTTPFVESKRAGRVGWTLERIALRDKFLARRRKQQYGDHR